MSAAHKLPPNVHPMSERHDFTDLRRAVRHDKRIPGVARAYFEDVCDLAEAKGYCWAEDEHFEEAFGVTDRSIRNWKSALVEAGYLRLGTQGGKPALTPVKSAAQRPKSQDRKKSSGAEKNFPSAENPFQESRKEFSDTESYITPEGGESGARAREGCPPDGLGSRSDVLALALAEGIPASVAAAGYDHYAAQGWVTGGRHPQPIVDRLAKLRQWAEREGQFSPGPSGGPSGPGAAGSVTAAPSGSAPGKPRKPSPAEMQRVVECAVKQLPERLRLRYESRHPSQPDPELDTAMAREVELLLQDWSPTGTAEVSR